MEISPPGLLETIRPKFRKVEFIKKRFMPLNSESDCIPTIALDTNSGLSKIKIPEPDIATTYLSMSRSTKVLWNLRPFIWHSTTNYSSMVKEQLAREIR